MEEIINYIQIILLLTILFVLATSTKKQRQPLKTRSERVLVLDSCALIDGRMLEIIKTGFAPQEIVIPQFILHELQHLADGQDAHKRERARFGLDVVQLLQSNDQVKVSINKTDFDKSLPTDERLVLLAKKLSADLATTDYNLNKVASIEGVRVLNVNELAKAVRPVALPGERKHVKIVQKGSNKDQGVGYLEDGTMVVVAGAARSIGKIVEAEISRYIQTDAGKMLFAQKLGAGLKTNTGSKKKPVR